MKYILVTGGVVSGLGKGVTASSIGLVLKSCGLRVTHIKIDPYLNVDAGTMSPFEHGEVYVLDDGGEADLDLGNYERFLDIKLTRDNNITTGKIYQHVIGKERKGDYLGKTVQIVPHLTDAIQEWIEKVAHVPVDGKDGPADVCVIELGGTIGDIESRMYTEALSQFSYRVGAGNFCLVHVSLVPVITVVGEQKTKPTQHSIRELRSLGLRPDILACRSTNELDSNVKAKLSQFCQIQVRIAMVGKYTGLSDAYLSVVKALLHASVARRKKFIVDWVAAHDLEDPMRTENPENYNTAWNLLKGAEGILVPGGFGDRGVEGKILAAKYARENRVPYLGICLGMQVAVIEYARSVLGLKDANSTEFDPNTRNPFVIFMPEGSKTHMGGTMRLGSRRTYFQVKDSKSAKLITDCLLKNAVNPEVVQQLEDAGLSFTGKDETGERMEIVEIPSHPFFVGAQFHPEFNSRPGKPSPLFEGLIAAAAGQLDSILPSSPAVSKKVVKERRVPMDSPHRKAARLVRSECVNGSASVVCTNGNGVHF
ncbi:hypothetical protein V2J09_022084 [Rumex salicifolius]